MNESFNPSNKKRVITWLFNPFMYIAGAKALVIGLIAIAAAAFISSMVNVHLDGVLDLHIGKVTPLWIYFAEGFINWLCMTIVLVCAGFILKGISFRVIDVASTQALARWPMVLSAISGLLPVNQRVMDELVKVAQNPNQPLTVEPIDFALYAAAMIIIMVMLVWMVALMYRAYTVSCNLKGAKGVISFIIALLIAETASKFAIWPLYQIISK